MVNMGDPNVLSVQQINVGDPWAKERAIAARRAQEEEAKRRDQSDPISMSKKLNNGFELSISVDEYGKVDINATKEIGYLTTSVKGMGDNKAKISIKLETTEKRTPAIKEIGKTEGYVHYGIGHKPNPIEVDDKKSTTTQSFKDQDEFYKREFLGGSVLTQEEFLSALFPQMESLLESKEFNDYADKISDSVGKDIQKPYNKNFIFGVDRRGRYNK